MKTNDTVGPIIITDFKLTEISMHTGSGGEDRAGIGGQAVLMHPPIDSVDIVQLGGEARPPGSREELEAAIAALYAACKCPADLFLINYLKANSDDIAQCAGIETMPDTPINIEQTMALLEEADLVVMVDGNGKKWAAENCTVHDTGFSVSACSGALNIYSSGNADGTDLDIEIGVRNGHRLHISVQGELRLYKEMADA